MANRILRPWTDSEAMDLLSANGEVFFNRLIMVADDYGRYHANPKLLKGALFPLKPYTDVQVAEWLEECLTAGVVEKYEVGGKGYVQIKNFGQRLRTMKGKFPEPPPDSPPPSIVSGPPSPVSTSPPEEREKGNEAEVETEVEVESERTLAWFEKLFDEIWVEQMQMVHSKKDIPQAIREAYGHIAGTPRLKIIDPGGAKRLVNTWLSNTKQQKQNGKNIRDRKEPTPGKSFGSFR